jgi:hypothetical protein
MPTPFNHLLAAGDLLPRLDPGLRRALEAELPAFLLGNIAPDVQTVSGQAREATHFFPVPLGRAPAARVALFGQHPALADPRRLPAAQAAFLAGYLAHLEFDMLWVRDIFEPVFGPAQTWGTFAERLYLHNALRAHWDVGDQGRLPADTGPTLAAAAPRVWLPFVRDADLVVWRDRVAQQLHADGRAHTLEVFAERMGVDVAAFRRLLGSPDEMAARVFTRVPPERLSRYRARALARSATVLDDYWTGALRP